MDDEKNWKKIHLFQAVGMVIKKKNAKREQIIQKSLETS